MSKKLPKTSHRTLDDLRKAANSALHAEETVHQRITPESFLEPAEVAPAQDPEPFNEKPAKTEPDQTVVRSQDKDASAVAVHARQERGGNRPDRESFRRSSANLIVERHANFAAIASLVPMPWVDLAAIAVVVDRMLRKLARLYGAPLERYRSKRLATAMLTGMAAPGIASLTTVGLLRMAPGPNILGMAITSVSATILIRIVGEVYISHLSAPDAQVGAVDPEPVPC
ncbi:YcjF family protein [Labrenzia sp. DG1229]|uniref:YcjF family protein n=1 Tax=Labrenzia sp. DG1229 TaxID=681847 RepID=UPI00048FC96D|nr:YcjF family protein [Labrenzia sp. DG1229]